MKRREFLTSLAGVSAFMIGSNYLAPAKASLNTASAKVTPYAWNSLVSEIKEALSDAVEYYIKEEQFNMSSQEFRKMVFLWLESELTSTNNVAAHLCSGWQLMFEKEDNSSMTINLSLCRKQNYTWTKIKIETGIAWT